MKGVDEVLKLDPEDFRDHLDPRYPQIAGPGFLQLVLIFEEKRNMRGRTINDGTVESCDNVAHLMVAFRQAIADTPKQKRK